MKSWRRLVYSGWCAGARGACSRTSALVGAAWLSTILLPSALLSAAEPVKLMKIASIEGINEYRLENGMKVLLFPDASKPTVTVNLTLFVGSRHEGYGEAGMAHLLEHMLFKGTPNHPQIVKDLQERGADFNGTTWLDRTNYYETLPASPEHLEFAIRLEADRMINSFVRKEDLESEMTVVRNEFERGEDNAPYVLEQRMMSAAFEWHNYGKTTIGNRADIERVPIERLQQFYKKFYQPDNAMLIVAGRFEEKQALEFIGKYFGTIPKPERVLDNTYTEEPPQDGERQVTLRRVGDVATVGVLYHIPAGAHPDFPAIDLLESICVSQPSGRLYKALVEQRKAASVDGATYALHDPGVLRFIAEVVKGNAPETVLDNLLDTLQNLVDRGVTAEEVDRARVKLLKQRELRSAKTAELAIELSEWAAQGDWRLYFLYRDRIEQVTAKDVDRVARAYLKPSNRTIGIYIPTQEPQRTPIPAAGDLQAMIGDYKGRESVSEGEFFDVQPLKIEARVKRTEIEGIKVALLPKKTRGGTVNVRLTLRYGTDKSLFGTGKTGDFLPALMTRGTKQLTRQQLQDALDQNLATLGSSGDVGQATFAIQTKREKLATVLGLLQQVLREPTLPADELEVIKQQVRTDLEQQLTDPQSIALRAVQRELNPYPVGDVRYMPSVEEELKLVDQVDVPGLRKLYADFLGAQAGQLSIVGDFDEAETVKIFQTMFKGWKASQAYERIVRRGDQTIKPRTVKINTPDKANAVYLAGALLPIRDDDPDYPALVIGNYVFGAGALSSRLGDRIRQKEGLSYGVGSQFRASALDKRGTVLIYAITNPTNVPKVITGIREEFELLIKDGVTPAELDAARTGYLQHAEVSRTEDATLARLLEEGLFAGRTMEFHAKLESAIKNLKPEQVLAALKKHFSAEKLLITVAGDFGEESAKP